MSNGKFIQTGTINKTSTALRTGVSKLRACRWEQGSRVSLHIATMLESNDKMRKDFNHPGQKHDQLFQSTYDHIEGQPTCQVCDSKYLLIRRFRVDEDPSIHYGLIGSANQVMKDGIARDKLREEKGILCFEMEAAGLMDIIPCLVIRGICDYADSHKNKRWQPYAAAAAAGYAKEILSVIPTTELTSTYTTNPNATNIHDLLRSIIGELNLEQLLQLLPVLEQKQSSPEALNLDPDEPQFSWVFRNIDYESWKSNESPSALCLSKLQAHHLSQIASYIVSREEKPNRLVLYCACSQIANSKCINTHSLRGEGITIINALICTLLEKIVLLSPIEKRVLIMRNFLQGLLQKSFEKKPTQDWIGHGFNEKNLLRSLQSFLRNVSKESLLAMFRMALDYTNQQYPLIVIDEIDKDQGDQLLQLIGKFVVDYQRQSSSAKVLLVGPAACGILCLPQDSLFIEYDKERKECLASLQFENTRYEKISPEHSGSFEWIWTHNEYKSWSKSETSGLLYIQGKPGSGKSTLTKYFSSNLRSREPATKRAIVAKFFYSSREGELHRSHYNMLLSLLHDILYQEEAFFYHYCQTEYRAYRCSRVIWDYTSLKRTLGSLQDYYSTTKRFYFIIDAVDESEDADRRSILSLLYDLCSKMKYCIIKILIASRPVTQLEARRDQFLNVIRLQDETMLDISNFANSLLDGLELTREIEYIIENAQGVFLWVKLVGEELLRFHEDGYSELDIFLMLKQLPTELDEVYALMLDKMRANSTCRSYGMRMFRFILFAKRPLRVNELLHSLGIPDDSESDSTYSLSDETFEKGVPLSERIIISGGGNFIEIKQQNNGHRIVQVIHQTALEFLRDPHGVVSKSEFYIDEGHAHMFIATTCIRYIMVCAANTSLRLGLPDSDRSAIQRYGQCAKYLDKRPLIFYASHHLRHHVDRCREYVNWNSNTQYLAAQLNGDWFNGPINYLLEIWTGSHLKPFISERIQTELLLAAAKGGFTTTAEILVSFWGADIMVSGHTPLLAAAENGHESTVRLLLEEGANIGSQGYSMRTPLLAASQNGHESIVRLLLEMGTDIDLSDHSGQSSLTWAAKKGYESIVKLLLEKGARTNSQDCSDGTPLWWATRNGNVAIVKLLRNSGATRSRRALGGR